MKCFWKLLSLYSPGRPPTNNSASMRGATTDTRYIQNTTFFGKFNLTLHITNACSKQLRIVGVNLIDDLD
jgi:hypothetical protein